MKKLLITLLSILIIASSLSGCKSNEDIKVYKTPVTNTNFMFDTVTSISIYSAKKDKNPDEILGETINMCRALEKKLSKTIDTSDVSLINNSKGEPVQVSEETIELINLSKKYYTLSNGSFDITIAPLSEKWNFKNKDVKPLSDEEIQHLLPYVGMDFIEIDGNTVRKTNPNSQIDLGGIAKGYIADKTAEYLKSKGVTSALINFGGNIVTIGNKPEGQPFKIGIQKPFSEANDIIGFINLENGTVVTSGSYERYFEYEGKKYHHILDPKTGKPAESGVTSVTIQCENSADADAISTACFVLGAEKGIEFIDSLDGVEAVFITDSGEIIKSKGSTFEEV